MAPYVDIIATEDNTVVTVTSPIGLPGSASIAALAADTPTDFQMNAGQLLHLVAPPTREIDISGLSVHASAPVAMLSGSRCASIPELTSYCDHIEQQLPPQATWDNAYVAAKFSPRGTEDDYWRVIGYEASTTVTFTPPQNGVGEVTLQRGEVYELASQEDFEITSTEPVFVGQFMVGSNYPGIPIHSSCVHPYDFLDGTGGCMDFLCPMYGGDVCVDDACVLSCSSEATCDTFCDGTPDPAGCKDQLDCLGGYCSSGSGIGDPAYSIAVPLGQYRQDYIVMTPEGYQENYLTIIARTGSAPVIDGARVNEAPISAVPTNLNGTWDIYRFPVEEGVHLLQDNAAFGVVTYGYNCDVSYAYPGGLNLEVIN